MPQAPVVPASPLPAGRSLSALRPSRGSNFIRLGIAALFLLGFIGLAAYFLKDTVSSYLGGSDVPDVPDKSIVTATSKSPDSSDASEKADKATPSKTTALADPLKPLAPETTDEGLTPPLEKSGRSSLPTTTGKDLEPLPTEPTIPKAEPASPSEIALSKTGEMPLETVAKADSKEKLLEVATTPADTQPKIPEAAPGAPTPRTAQTGSLDDKPTEEVPQEAQPSLAALKSFLGASSTEERLRYVLGPELMKPLIDRYYSRNNDGPITVDHISFGRYDKQPELGTGAHCIFHIESKTWEYPVPAMLEEQPDGWKVDWLTFIELKDRKLEDFFKTYQEGKAMFHVGIFRQHYFGDEVPNREQKDAFSVGLPRPNPFRAPVFLSKDAELSRNLRERLPWEVHVWAIVELEWKKLGSQQWVELVSMPQMHWYSLPASPRPISTSEKPAVEVPSSSVPSTPARSSSPTIMKAAPVQNDQFPPGIRRSPATRSR